MWCEMPDRSQSWRLRAGHQHPLGLRRSDELDEPQGIGQRRHEAELRNGNAELRASHRDPEIAGGSDDATAADRVALDHRDHRLRQRTQRRLQLLEGRVVVERAFRRRQRLPELVHVGA